MPINDKHSLYEEVAPDWLLCRDCYAGERMIKEKRKTYLPYFGFTGVDTDMQVEADYKTYLTRANFYGAYRRTVHGLTGSAFRKEWELQEGSGDSESIFRNIDSRGFSLNEQARIVTRNILIVGREGLWVDYDNASKQPIITRWPAESIINWPEFDGRLRGVVLRSAREDYSDDEFSPKIRTLYIHLTLVDGIHAVDIYESNDDDELTHTSRVFPTDDNDQPITVIPFIFINTDDLRPTPSSPLLLDLANVNLDHYRLDASLKNGLFVKGIPIPYFFGTGIENSENDMSLASASKGISSSSENAKVGFMETTQGFDAIAEAQNRDELRMAALGSRILEEQRTEAEAALAIQYRTSSETSLLASVVKNIGEGYNKALSLISELYGIERTVVRANTDFLGGRLDANEINALIAGWQSGAITTELLVHNWRVGELLPDNLTDEKVIAEINERVKNVKSTDE